jgi:superfamily II DNA/RNA helicase
MPPEIQRLTSRFLRDPIKIEVARQNSVVETIEQRVVRVSGKPEEKRDALRRLIRGEENLKNAIIFCNRKRDVATLARSLERHGFSAGGLHGDMDQKSRMETLDSFKTDKLKLLIASDVAARGLDIPAVSHVFNFDVPTHAEDYVHRIGRTGRAGRSGVAITLTTPSDGKYIDAITKLIGKDIPEVKLGGAPVERAEAAPASAEERRETRGLREGRGRRGGRGTRETTAPREAVAPQANAVPQEPPALQEMPAPQESREPRGERTERSRRPARNEAPRNEPRRDSNRGNGGEKPAREPHPEHVEGIVADSPFGSDGPIPAFLLRK